MFTMVLTDPKKAYAYNQDQNLIRLTVPTSFKQIASRTAINSRARVITVYSLLDIMLETDWFESSVEGLEEIDLYLNSAYI